MYRRAESRFVDRPFDSTRDEGLSEQFPRSASGRNALGVAVEAARNAGDVILKRSDTHKEISFKGRANVVTDVDVLAEKVALELLRHEYPNFGILSEESEPLAGDSRYTWVVDPLDGSRNYASGIPHVAVVVALALDDEVVLGVTYDPIRDELYTAEKGQGAYLNDVRISVSPREIDRRLPAWVRHGLRRREGGNGAGHDKGPLAGHAEHPHHGFQRPWSRLRRLRPS